MAEAFFTFAGGSWLSTPNTPDLQLSGEWEHKVDVAIADAAIGGSTQTFTDNGFSSLGGERFQWQPASFQRLSVIWRDGGGLKGETSDLLPLVADAERNVYAIRAGLTTYEFRFNGAPVGSGVVTGKDPNTSGVFIVGARPGGVTSFVGDLWSVTVSAGPGNIPVLSLKAGDVILPSGPLIDGQTFTTAGRVWTVHGSGISFMGESLESTFALETEGTIAFPDGVELPVETGLFALEADAAVAFDGYVFAESGFALATEADLVFDGQAEMIGGFSLNSFAELSFSGEVAHISSFGLSGTAQLGFFWVPLLCPGTAAVGCAVGPASVTDTLYPAEACTCQREGC